MNATTPRLLRSLRGLAQPPFIALILIGIGMAIATNRFLTFGNLRNIAWEVSVVGIMAIGSTMVIVTAGIDLSPGAMLAVVSMTTATLMTENHLGLGPAIVIGIAAGAALGLINGMLVAWGRVAPFIATLGTMTAYQGIAYLFHGGTPYFNVSNDLEQVFYGKLLGISLPIWYVVVLYVASWSFLRYTVAGRSIYAVGGNPTAARLSGMSVRQSLILAYTLAGVLAAFAGVLMTAQLNAGSADYGTSGLELQAIAAAVIGGASLFGGTGNVGLTLVGSLIIVEIENGLDLQGVPSTWKNIALGIIIVVAVGVDGWRSEFAGLGKLFRTHPSVRRGAPTVDAAASMAFPARALDEARQAEVAGAQHPSDTSK